jgi:hypothetical protein
MLGRVDVDKDIPILKHNAIECLGERMQHVNDEDIFIMIFLYVKRVFI